MVCSMVEDMSQNPKICDRLHAPIMREIKALRELMEERKESYKDALELAKLESDRRMHEHNNFEKRMASQAADSVRREVFEVLVGRVVELERFISRSQGSSRWSDHIVTVLIGLAVILIVWAIQR